MLSQDPNDFKSDGSAVDRLVSPQHHQSQNHRLGRNEFKVRGDLMPNVARNIFYASLDLDGRFKDDRQREYLLTIGMIETALNIEDVNHYASGNNVPETLVLETYNGERLVSARTFAKLKFRSSSISYSQTGREERPIHKCVYEGTLVESKYFQTYPESSEL